MPPSRTTKSPELERLTVASVQGATQGLSPAGYASARDVPGPTASRLTPFAVSDSGCSTLGPALSIHGRNRFTRAWVEPASYATPLASTSSRHHTQPRAPVADRNLPRVTGEPVTLRKHAPDWLPFDLLTSEEASSPPPEGAGSVHATFKDAASKPASSPTAVCAHPVERFRSASPLTFRPPLTWWTPLGFRPPSSALPVSRDAETSRST
jgi:hypothetical protein